MKKVPIPSRRNLSLSIGIHGREQHGHLQPSPTAPSVDASHLENTGGQKRTKNVASAESGPEKGQSKWQFIGLVEVGEPKDDITKKG